MIVTFHIAVYLVYYVWNTYISPHNTDNQSTPNNSGSSQSDNVNRTNPTTTNGVESRPNEASDGPNNSDLDRPMSDQSRQNPNISPGDVDKKQKSTAAMEGEGDFHICLPHIFSDDEDKGRDVTNKVEPEYVIDHPSTHINSGISQYFYGNQPNPAIREVSIETFDVPTNRELNSALFTSKPSSNQSRQNSNISPEDMGKKQKSTAAMEGEGDYHICLPHIFSDDEEKERVVTNKVEPEYIIDHQRIQISSGSSQSYDENQPNLAIIESSIQAREVPTNSSLFTGRPRSDQPTNISSDVDPNIQSQKSAPSKEGEGDLGVEISDIPTNRELNSALFTGRPSSNQSRQNSNISLEDVDKKQKSTAAMEGEDYHICLPHIFSDDEDKGRDMIYKVEPEYSCICTDKKIQFFPPVYIQRYMEIEKILKEPHWTKIVKKVVDFGCAELKFEMKYLKKIYGVEEVIAVDIDTEMLENNCCKLSPFPSDYLKKRPTPLTMRVFHGSVAHTHESLTGVDAVIAIELVEHLFPPELDCLPFTVFGFIKPKIAIFTTPNSDFNVLFPGLSGFRHPDHKFEWSQQQFEDWAHNLVQRYPEYQVTFKGIGPGPPGSEKYGCCSQMATFIKVNESNPTSEDEIHVQDGPYTLIAENVFPYFKDERTEEEKIKDAAERFINNCKMRSKISDEVRTDIPITSVMGRIKYYDKEKLKEILVARNWEVKINLSGEEVVVFPESEEEEDSEPEPNEFVEDNFETIDNDHAINSPVTEENWDYEEDNDFDMIIPDSLLDFCDDQVCLGRKSGGDHACVSDESYRSVDTVNTKINFPDCTNIEKLVSSDKLNFSHSEKCSITENTVPDKELSDKLSSSHTGRVPKKDSNLNFESSIYETPYIHKVCDCLKSDCDFSDCSLPSDHAVKGCKRALIMETTKELSQFEVNSHSEDPFRCSSTVSSSCDTSTYATPCCSQRHRNNIPKCLSLQQISTCDSPVFSTELETTLKEGELVRDKKDEFSKSMEGFKSLENDLTCSSTSKVVDSGYPDSYSEYNMDMDLTPEQFDDIETENDASSHSLSPPPPPPQVPRLIDDVQNGDVANNNRDGEGNNLVADIEEEPIEFEARIEEINNEVLNLAPADEINNEELNLAPGNDAIDFDHDMKLGEPLQGTCGDCLPYISDPPSMSELTNGQCMSEKTANVDFSRKSVFVEKSTVLSDLLERQSLRSTKSDTSIATNHSSSLDPSEGQMNSNSEGASYQRKKQSPKFKTHSSLTTVLDGRSKYSNCSLVRPVEVYQVTGLETGSPNSTPSGSRGPVQEEGTTDAQATASLTSTGLTDDGQSLSVYQSAESLNNMRELQTECRNETSSFPDWLLKILVSDLDENEADSVDSVQSVWDSDSLDERMDLNYDVQVDARGGGDPQRDTWH